MQQTATAFTRHYRVQWLLVVLALVALGVAVALLAAYERQRTLRREGDLMMLQARMIDENLGQQLAGMAAALDSVREKLPSAPASRLPQVSERLKALTDAMPGVRTMLVTDAQGTIRASNWPDVIGRDVRQRAYFQTARAQPALDRLYVSEPFETLLNVYSLNVVKIWTDEQGRFAGIISATLDPAYFQVLLHSVLYAPDMRSTVIHGGGMAFITIPAGNPIAGVNLRVPGSFFTRHLDGGQQASLLRGRTRFSGEERMAAYRTVQPEALHMDRPLVLSVSRAVDAVLAPWRTLAWLYGLAYLAVALVTCASTLLLQRKQRELVRLSLRRERESREYAEKIDLALAGADLGLWELDLATGRRTVNARAQHMLGLAPDAAAEALPAWTERIHPDDRDAFNAILASNAPFAIDYRARHEDGQWVWLHSRGKPARWDDSGAPQRLIGTYLDITQRKDAEERVAALAFHDPLTRLPNRRLLQDRLEQVQRVSARARTLAALLFLDLDRFKSVNDTLGHGAGDQLLLQVAQRLQACVRHSDTVARLGGDEFVLLVHPLGDTPRQAAAHAQTIAHGVLAALQEPVLLGGRAHTVTMSIGVALFCGTEESTEQLFKRADQAMYQAKAAGRNQAHVDDNVHAAQARPAR
ncbi:MAG: diguanylate cyclase [Acidovorax sp.]